MKLVGLLLLASYLPPGYVVSNSAWLGSHPCIIGTIGFATDAVAGQNWFVCVASDTWKQMFGPPQPQCLPWHGYCLHQPSLPIPKELQ
jgi:hypothetical protein